MDKYLMKGNKNDLRCEENHQNSVALFLQINLKSEEQNKLLCFQCLEKLNVISNLISVDALIEKIKSKHEEYFDTRKKILTLVLDQLVEVDKEIEQVFKILHGNIQEWKNQLQNIFNQPIQFDLKQEILFASDQKYLNQTCINDITQQLHNHFVNTITEKVNILNEILKLTKIKEIYEQINFEQQKIEFASFPKSIEQVNEICTGSKRISSVQLNFDNTLLFFGQDYQVVSFSLKSAQQEIIVERHHLPKIVASKNKNLIVIYSKNQCEVWCCEKASKWIKLGDYTENNALSNIYLNIDDNQIIAKTKNNDISIVQINYEGKTLFKIQQISNCISFHMNSLRSKILVQQKSCLLIYKQQQDISEWILQDKITLNQKELIMRARFIQNDDIFIIYKTENSEERIMHYVQNQFVRFETKNATFKIDEKQYLFRPNLYNKERQLYLQETPNKILFIIMKNNNYFVCERAIYFTGNQTFFAWSTDGKIFVIGDLSSFKVKVYQLNYH